MGIMPAPALIACSVSSRALRFLRRLLHEGKLPLRFDLAAHPPDYAARLFESARLSFRLSSYSYTQVQTGVAGALFAEFPDVRTLVHSKSPI